MVNANQRWRSLSLGCVVSVLLALTGSVANAQTTPPPEAPPGVAEPAPPVAAPAVVTPQETTIPTAPAVPPPPPPAAAEPPPPPPPAASKDPRGMSMTMNAWGRWGFKLQDPSDPEKMDKVT